MQCYGDSMEYRRNCGLCVCLERRETHRNGGCGKLCINPGFFCYPSFWNQDHFLLVHNIQLRPHVSWVKPHCHLTFYQNCCEKSGTTGTLCLSWIRRTCNRTERSKAMRKLWNLCLFDCPGPGMEIYLQIMAGLVWKYSIILSPSIYLSICLSIYLSISIYIYI